MLNYTKEECKSYIQKLNEEYLKKHLIEQERDELIGENNVESRDIKGYHGREILELLQNADDAYQKSINDNEKPDCDLNVNIKYIDNVLTISNSGTFFDKDGIKAIVQGNNSSKHGGFIGCKGTGFRSVLNWASKIRIFSGNFRIEFSKEKADLLFDSIKDNGQIRKQLLKQKKLYIPMLSVPQYIDEEQSIYDENLTTIEITIDESKIQDDFNVEKQLRNIDSKILLFLPNISTINIETKNLNVTYKRDRVNDENIQSDSSIKEVMSLIELSKVVNGEESEKEIYKLFERIYFNTIYDKDGLTKDFNIAIAVPNEIKTLTKTNLYTFFPLLETKTPFDCIMHATYELSDQRNTIIKNEINKKIINEQLKFLVYIVNNYYIKNKEYDKAARLLSPSGLPYICEGTNTWKFNLGFSAFEVENYYLELLKDSKIFETVNEESMSIVDEPKLIKDNFPKFLKGDSFYDILKPIKDKKVCDFLQLLCNYFKLKLDMKEEVLADKISNVSSNWTIEEQVECFDWWCGKYKNCLPNLLKASGKWLQKDSECYFLDGSFAEMKLPEWANVCAIDKEYQTALFKIAEKNEKVKEAKRSDTQYTPMSRIIAQNNIYPLIKFNYRDRSNIITTVNSSINGDYQRSVEFVKWLWNNYSNEQNWTPPLLDKVKYNFPSDRGKVVSSQQLYFSDEYDNNLSSKLFAVYGDEYQKFPSMQVFDVEVDNIIHFKRFIEKFKVLDYPVVEAVELESDDLSYRYKAVIVEQIKERNDYGASNTFHIKGKVLSVKKLGYILASVSFYDVICWIYNDNSLHSKLHNKRYIDNKECDILYKGNSQRNDHALDCKLMISHLNFVFNNTKWIEIDGNRYCPNEIVFDYRSKANKKFSSLIPVIGEDILEDISKQLSISVDEIVDILELFDFCKNVTDLNSNLFYELMLKIPNCEKKLAIEMSRHIYRIIERNDFNKDYDCSNNKNKFFMEGKLLTCKGEFILATQIYLPSSKIVKKNQYDILDKGQRSNNVNFIKIFGCKEYDKEFKINDSSIKVSPHNDCFQKELVEFKKYTLGYNEFNQNIKNCIDRLSIILVDSISISIDDIEEVVKEKYTEIRQSETKWYITLSNEEYDIFKLSVCIENIFTNISNASGFDASKYGELFRADKKTKEFLVSKDFGSSDFIYEEMWAEKLKEKFIGAIKLVDSNFELTIFIDFNNIDTYESISKIVGILRNYNFTSVSILYDNGFDHKLNLTEYYKKEIKKFINNEKNSYKNYLYQNAKNDDKLQKSFLNDYAKFENYEVDTQEDLIDIKEFMIEKFGNWDIKCTCDADKEYEKNYNTLNPDNKFSDDIQNNKQVQLMIYFKDIESFKKWVIEKENMAEKEKAENIDPYAAYPKIIPQHTEINYSNPFLDSSNKDKRVKNNSHVYTESSDINKRKKQKILGNIGELMVYNLLCNKEGIKDVKAKSEAFVELGILKAGQAESHGYDIEYTDIKLNKTVFVEVKTGESNSFYISPNELEFAKKHSDQYVVYVVYDVDTDTPRYEIIDEKFWDNDKYKLKEIVEKYQVKF